MEVAPFGEMFTRITNEGRYEEAAAQKLYSQLVSAIEFMVGATFLSMLAYVTLVLSS